MCKAGGFAGWDRAGSTGEADAVVLFFFLLDWIWNGLDGSVIGWRAKRRLFWVSTFRCRAGQFFFSSRASEWLVSECLVSILSATTRPEELPILAGSRATAAPSHLKPPAASHSFHSGLHRFKSISSIRLCDPAAFLHLNDACKQLVAFPTPRDKWRPNIAMQIA